MRWKLLRRRLSISAPRMIVRSHLPWPLRWVCKLEADNEFSLRVLHLLINPFW